MFKISLINNFLLNLIQHHYRSPSPVWNLPILPDQRVVTSMDMARKPKDWQMQKMRTREKRTDRRRWKCWSSSSRRGRKHWRTINIDKKSCILWRDSIQILGMSQSVFYLLRVTGHVKRKVKSNIKCKSEQNKNNMAIDADERNNLSCKWNHFWPKVWWFIQSLMHANYFRQFFV